MLQAALATNRTRDRRVSIATQTVSRTARTGPSNTGPARQSQTAARRAMPTSGARRSYTGTSARTAFTGMTAPAPYDDARLHPHARIHLMSTLCYVCAMQRERVCFEGLLFAMIS